MKALIRLFSFLLLAVWLCLPAPARAAWWSFGDDSLDYTIGFSGVDDEMKAWFKQLGLDEKNDVNPPKTRDDLEQEASSLAANVKRALDAKGYLEARTEPHFDATREPPVLTVNVDMGARYPVGSIALDWTDREGVSFDVATLKTKTGAPLDMGVIEEDAIAIMDKIGAQSCYLSLSVAPKLHIHRRARTTDLIFTISHGPRANFGEVRVEGNQRVNDAVVRRAVAWKRGECFTSAKVDATRTALIDNQLFSTVEIMPASAPDASGEAPITIAVKERVARTIGAGVDYSTDTGFGVRGSWEHRNLFGDAEKLTTNLTLAEREQKLDGRVQIPAFMRDDQLLSLSTSLKREDTDAYQASGFDGSAVVERRLSKRLNVGLGVGYTLSHTEDVLNGTNDYALLSFPGFVEYDSRDNLLDARRGIFTRLAATPYTETIGEGGQFVKLLGTAQTYLSSKSLPYTPTLATRLSLGSINGGSGVDVPADIRFYAGGGGSVRGYSYQSLAPSVGGQPIGGSSLTEGSAELRMRFTPTIGGVVFADAGNAAEGASPEFSNLYYGAGVGVRYYSAIGPIRADVAFPLNGEDIGQTGYQLYVSVGQSF